MAQIQDFVPIKLVFADSDDEFEIKDFHFEVSRSFQPDGSNVSTIQGGLTICTLDVSDEGPKNFFSQWLADTGKRQVAIFEFFLAIDKSHFNSVRLFEAAIVDYVIQNTRDNEFTSRLRLTLASKTFTVLDTNLGLGT